MYGNENITMVAKKGKFYQLNDIEREMVEDKHLELISEKTIPCEMSATEFWNKLGEEYFPKLKKNVKRRKDNIYLNKIRNKINPNRK